MAPASIAPSEAWRQTGRREATFQICQLSRAQTIARTLKSTVKMLSPTRGIEDPDAQFVAMNAVCNTDDREGLSEEPKGAREPAPWVTPPWRSASGQRYRFR